MYDNKMCGFVKNNSMSLNVFKDVNFCSQPYDTFMLLSYFELFNINRARTIGVKKIKCLSDLLLLLLRQFLFGSCFLALNCTGFSVARCLNTQEKVVSEHNLMNKTVMAVWH